MNFAVCLILYVFFYDFSLDCSILLFFLLCYFFVACLCAVCCLFVGLVAWIKWNDDDDDNLDIHYPIDIIFSRNVTEK